MSVNPRDMVVSPDAGSTPGRYPPDAGFANSTGSIARMENGTALSSGSLEAKRLVHVDHQDPRSSDVFRELRSLLMSAAGINNPVILVCGVRHRVGASFIARNLAASIAMDAEHTALLIDCHWRRPSQQQVFELGAGPGVADYLRTPGMPLEEIIYPSGVPRLRVIPAGAPFARDADMLGSLRMRSLLSGLSQRYDDRCVILDAPPARGSPEAHTLAKRADLVLLVAGEGMHRAEDVLAAAATFDPAKLAGVVFNEMP